MAAKKRKKCRNRNGPSRLMAALSETPPASNPFSSCDLCSSLRLRRPRLIVNASRSELDAVMR
jgi:hypothetical protein